jgi:hypothetical protein
MIWSSDYEVGLQLHRRVVAEGGWMVHQGDRSWFERRDADGSLTRRFSDDLMTAIKWRIKALKVYAAHRRRGMEQIADRRPPPGVGSSGEPAPPCPTLEGLRMRECNAETGLEISSNLKLHHKNRRGQHG